MIFCTKSNQNSFPFILPELPYDKSDFVPYFTSETFNYHHGKHHQAYVNNLNKLLENEREFSGKNLEEIIIASVNLNPGIFNNAAQIWNHSFFWHSIKPGGGGKPSGILFNKITKDFGSYKNFVTEFKQAATTQFGSGWAWLVHNDNKLQIIKTGNAETPITKGIRPLLACDVWEHAYYIDYRNNRPDYLSVYIDHMINWDFAEANLKLD